ncbi:hypothetical protein RND81_12G143400 [Saponaria officinalis]|uniref:Thiaminase-2/PQQC domain-containing protein n=1 Tax=Saponaria officinalis TaxID=3572 RepID=A0AAW1HAE9_SAPOF
MKKKEEKMKMIETWMRKHKVSYFSATHHPFILNIRHASIHSSFKCWLGQDYLFVRNFVPFVASVLMKCAKESDNESDMEVILAGMASLHDEIAWFKKEAAKWDVQLTRITPHKTNQNYWRFLESLMQPDVDYTVAVTAFWTIEALEACERWGNEGFGQYCSSLQEIAERSLSKVSDDVKAKAEVTFLRVLEEEVEFWNMSEGPDKDGKNILNIDNSRTDTANSYVESLGYTTSDKTG